MGASINVANSSFVELEKKNNRTVRISIIIMCALNNE